jgi:hypothetical protein
MDTKYGRSYFDLATSDWLYHERYLVRHCLSCALDDMAPQVQYGYGVVINEHYQKHVRGLCAQNVRRDLRRVRFGLLCSWRLPLYHTIRHVRVAEVAAHLAVAGDDGGETAQRPVAAELELQRLAVLPAGREQQCAGERAPGRGGGDRRRAVQAGGGGDGAGAGEHAHGHLAAGGNSTHDAVAGHGHAP